MTEADHKQNVLSYYENILKTSDYYEEKHRNTLRELNRFLSGDAGIDTSIVPQEILDSWIRSRDFGVDPFRKPQPVILEGSDLQNLLDENENFINVSIVFMNYLYQFIKDSHFSVSLFDKNGYILKTIVREEYQEDVRRGNWFVGALWDEVKFGTNTVGTLLKTRKPLTLFGPQHYNKAYHRHIALSAPIFGPDNKFMGGISVTCYFYWVANPHTLGLPSLRQRIENELQSRQSMAETQIANIYQKTVISSIPEVLITIDNRGKITLINENAGKMLSLDPAQATGRYLNNVFGEENRPFLDLIENDNPATDAEIRVFTALSANDYTLTCNPVFSPEGEKMGKIIILKEIERVKTLVTKMIGAKANFQFKDIYGQNPKFLKTLEQARMVSRSTSNTLLLGKSGTGKDIFAQAIHNESSRKNNPYVAINCAAIPRDLIASELFGYEEGSFTGSRRGGSHGKFELADGGTIFLDEIAEIPLELQAVLLRVLEEKSITRIGGKRVRPVDVRIIAATNKDLRDEIRKGNFREDLYYRLNVFSIHMVPLKERAEDIPLLLDIFIKKYGNILGKKIEQIDTKVLNAFYRYHWPGNIRELQNVVERMMNYAQENQLTVEHIPAEIMDSCLMRDNTDVFDTAKTKDSMETPRRLVANSNMHLSLDEEAERDMMIKMLNLGIKKKKIAHEMNLSRVTVYRKMKKYKLS
jgi:transcriptional regulator with PAS, ATPase and Fis domain